MPAPHFLEPLLAARPDARLALYVASRPQPVATTIEGAFDSKARNRGLLGRTGLPPATAIVIAPSNAVHTFFMKFPIDLIYAARDGRVVKVRHAVPAWRLSAAFGAFAVIEMAAGGADGVKAGDTLEIKALVSG